MKNVVLKSILLSLSSLIVSLPALSTEEFSGRVIGVSDGDTITVLAEGQPRKIRLSGIDCPEKLQAFGQQAKAFTSKQSFSKEVTVVATGHDRYRRTIGEVYLPDGKNLNNLLLEHGYAWWYQRYSHDEYRHDLEESAKKSRTGLWVDPLASAPWDYRKIH